MSRPKTPVTRAIMQAAPNLRIVAKYGIGVDDVDTEAATALGVLVTHGPAEANWGGVAESAMTMMLAVLKNVRQRDAFVRGGGWHDDSLIGTYVGARDDGYAGLTIGIVGLGRVGGRFARLLAPWRARIIACDPYIDPSRFVEHGAQAVDLPTLLRASDVVSLHVPLNSETRHLVDREALARMKPTAIVLNTSRGSVIDEAALAAGLAAGEIAGAALDVFEREPLPADSPLRSLGDKVLLSPHIGASNHGAGWEVPGVQWAAEAVIAALRGQVPRHVFNRSVLEAWNARFGGHDLLAGNDR
jgi:phosphoglycerate dehydrogenase-like enzyme